MCSSQQHLLSSCALLATIQILKIPLNNFPSRVELHGNQAPLLASSPSQWPAFQPQQSPFHCLRAVLTHPFLDFAVRSAMKTLPCLAGLKNFCSSCNTQLQSFSVKASLTDFPTLTRMMTPLYLAYPECYSSASTRLCVTFVYCTYVVT